MPGVSLAFAAGVAQTITSLQRRPLLEGCTEGHVKTKGLSFQRCGRVMARRSLHLCTGRRATAVAVLRNGDTKNGHDGKRSSGIPPLAESLLLPHPNPLAVGNDREQLQETADGKEQVADEFNVGNDSRWPTLHETLWEFNESTAMARGALGSLIAPAWRVMLLSDGSVTRHLQLLTDAKIKVQVLRHNVVRQEDLEDEGSVPADVLKKINPHMYAEKIKQSFPSSATSADNRNKCDEEDHQTPASCVPFKSQVDLCRSTDGLPLVYASSWWTIEAAKKFNILKSDGGATERAVWMHLSDKRTELYREIRRMYLGESPELEAAWGVKGPFWARHYIFWAGSCPLCVIYEVFSPKLEQYLGGCEGGSVNSKVKYVAPSGERAQGEAAVSAPADKV